MFSLKSHLSNKPKQCILIFIQTLFLFTVIGLEASDATMTSRLPTSSSTTTSDTSSTSVPSAYAGNKDWNAIERQLKKEEDEEKPEGEEALNALFRQIYGKL